MLRRRSNLASYSCFSSNSMDKISSTFFNVPVLFVGFTAKGLHDSDSAKSPTSPLDHRIFSNFSLYKHDTTRVLLSWRHLSILQPHHLEEKLAFLKDVLLLSAAAFFLMSAAVILQSSLSPNGYFLITSHSMELFSFKYLLWLS